jgi:hypothetical protein
MWWWRMQMRGRPGPRLAVLVLVAIAAFAAACSSDPTPTPAPAPTATPTAPFAFPGGPPGEEENPNAFTLANYPDLSFEELDYFIASEAAWKLFGNKNDRFVEVFSQTWPLPELLLSALYDAGAGTAFLGTEEALEALTPPERFVAEHELVLTRIHAIVEVDARIGEAVKAGDAKGFWRLNIEMAGIQNQAALASSRPTCIANSGGLLCSPDASGAFEAGSYQNRLNTAVRTLEAGLRATAATLPPNMGLTPNDLMLLFSENSAVIIQLLGTAVAATEALIPPEVLEADHDRFVEYLRTAVGLATEAHNAAHAQDLATFGSSGSAAEAARCETTSAIESLEFVAIVESHLIPIPECAPAAFPAP